MKNFLQDDPAFRVVFVLLVAAALSLLVWQCARRPPEPSRIAWPTNSTAKP